MLTVKLITVLATIAAPILIVVHEFLAGAGSMKVRVYTCKKHPKWSLETAAPVIAGSLQTCLPTVPRGVHHQEHWIAGLQD